MKKSKYRLELFFKKMVGAADSNNEIINEKEGAVIALARITEEKENYVRIFLSKLEGLKLIEKVYSTNSIGRGQLIACIKILNKNFPEKNSACENKQTQIIRQEKKKKEKTEPQEKEKILSVPILPTVNGSRNNNLAAVLVDYDNVYGVMTKQDFEISFLKLRDFCRKFGRIIFCDVFLSPTSSKRQEVISMLWQSGFEVFVCPMQTKDKDGVDVKMKNRIRKYTEYSDVQKLIIVSEDRDLSHDPEINELILDLGKEIVIVKPSNYRPELEGKNQFCEDLGYSRKTDVFVRLVNSILKKDCNFSLEDKIRVEFLKDIVKKTHEITENEMFSFRTICNAVWARLNENWNRNFDNQDLKRALTALVDASIITPLTGKLTKEGGNRAFTYYRLNLRNEAVMSFKK